MRYEDASQSGSSSNENPVARDDADGLAAGSRGPATGNVISGAGTLTGASGADLGAEHAHIVSVSGQHGSDSSFAGGNLVVDGQFGRLSIDAEGNYSYLANKGAPEASRDPFTYKLADAQGHSDSATLTIEIGKSPAVVQANAKQVVPGPDGVVVLPAGVQLSDVHVVGRNLVIDLPDGTQMLIIDGAVFVPQLVLGDVEVPATSLAALLIGSELRPAAGSELAANTQSGGGNFAVPLSPLDPGVGLGDLIPPTELAYVPPDYKEVALVEDSEPSILIQTPDQPAGIENATASVNESALPARGLEPAGSNSASSSESTTGTIVYTSLDTPNVITIGGVAVTAVGQVIAGTYGSLMITSIADGAIGYSYTLADNTLGDATSELFTVVITDSDGDKDSATLTISIVDDVPTLAADVDSVREDSVLVADGNVLTGKGGVDANATDGVADVPGADGISLTGIAFGGTNGAIGSPLAGAYGSLVLSANGAYVYTLNNASTAVQALGANESLTETFTYTVTDGDGDVRSTTLTITINGTNDLPTVAAAAASVSEEGLAAGNPDNVGLPADSTNSATATGQLAIADVDGDALSVRLQAPAGSLTSHGQPISWSLSADGHVLTGSAGGTSVITVTVADNGSYSVALLGQVDHPNNAGEDVIAISVPVSVSDGTATVTSTLTVSVEDDSPVITSAPVLASSVMLDETAGSDPLSSGPAIVATSGGAIISAGVSFGGDGPGAAPVYGLALQGGTSIASGLQTAAGDQPITLTLTNSTLITATYNGGTQTAFTIQMNANGSITVTQFTALEHLVDGSTAAAYDDALSLVAGGASLVSATVTYVDFDGDRVSASAAIGSAITFRDDGPSIDVTANASAEAGILLTTSDDGTEGAGSTSAMTASGNFGGTFGLTFATGADGAPTPSLAFALNATTTVSGLSSHGLAINLYTVGGVVVGSTAATAPASANDASVVFAVSVSAAGVVTLTQYQQVDHPLEAGSNNAPFADQLASLADGAITLTASSTITDNDGDSASDSATISIGANLRFADDGPDIAASLVQGATIRVDETDGVAAAGGEIDPVGGNLGSVTMAASSLFTVSNVAVSADAPTTLAYQLSISAPGVASGLLLSTTNEAILLVNNGGVVEGRVGTSTGALAFSVSIDSATGATTLTQYLAVEHGNTASNDEDSSGLAAGVLAVNVTATDYDGDTDVASVDLGSIIRFEDDGPTAVNDSATQSAEDANVLVDVFANDLPGSDGALASSVQLVPGSQVGAGTIINNGNGTFTLDPVPGQIGTVSFNYSFVDSDGDPAQGTVTITLAPDSTPTVLVAAGSDTSVDEAALSVGSNPGSNGEFAAGSLVITTGNDTVGSLLVNGVDVTNGGTVTSSLGVLTVTGSPTAGYSYSYQLTAVTTDVANVAETDSFAITVIDSDGDPDSTSLVIDIVDDVPTARDDSATQAPENASVLVDVMTNDTVGADGVDLTTGVSLVAGSLNGGGTLVYNNNGTFTYTPSAGEEGTVTFRYQIVDGDGDPSIATVTIQLAPDSTPTVLVAQGSDTSVDEAALSVGSNPGSNGEFAAGSLVITTGNDTVGSLLVNGVDVTNGGTVTSSLGVLTVTGSPTAGYSYSYQLTAVTTDVANVAETDSFAITVIDSDGDPDSTSLVIDIVDDVPTARDDSATQAPENASVLVDVMTNDTVGADGVDLTTGVSLVAGSLNGGGTLVYNNNGTFTYTPSAGEEGTVTFRYQIVDGDGDPSIATVTIQLAPNSTPTVLVAQGSDTSVDEAALSVGSNPGSNGEFAAGSLVITTGNDTVGSLLVNGVDVTNGGTVTSSLGVLTVTGSPTAGYSYSYQLTAVTTDVANVAETDSFAITVIDSDGDPNSTSLVIDIVDDVPTARDDSATQAPENASVLVDVMTNDTVGADGVDLTTGVSLVAGSLNGGGTLVYNNNGTFTYTPSAGEEGTVTFRYQIVDGDGDPSIATVTIQLAPDSTPTVLVAQGSDTSVDEAALSVGSNPGSNGEFAAGSLVITTGNDTVGSLLVNGVDVTNGGTVTSSLGVLTVTGSPTAGYSYSYQLTAVTTDVANVAETDSFAITVIDSDGDPDSTSLVIDIVDDVPTAAISTTGFSISHDETPSVQTDANDVAGPLAVFAGVTNPGDDPDVAGSGAIGYALSSGSITSTGTVLGADGGTTAFSLSVSTAGVDSGLNTTAGQDILLYKEGDLVVGRVGSASGPAAFAVAIDAATGVISLVQYLSIQHPNTTSADESVFLATGAILATVTATDGDGDVSIASTGIGNLISFQDDGPRMVAASNINIQNSGDVAAGGTFEYNLGADGAPTSNDVFKAVTGSATVNNVAVTNYVISETSETAATAVYSFSFDYPAGSSTVHETGTLTFDKTLGTYTVDLANPIAGVTLVDTAGAPASAFVNYNTNGTVSSGPSQIATVQLGTNLFIQFTGDAEPGSGTGSNNLSTTQAPGGEFDPTTGAFTALELFTTAAATVTVSSTAAGVAGNTIQGGEVLDFNLYSANPGGDTTRVPTANATSLFIELDGVGTSEDFIIVLKLLDTSNGKYTTLALMVQNGDIITDNAALAGTIYSGIHLDSNDGLVVIEANDYQGSNTNLVIVGAQIAGSDEGIIGTAVDFNGTTGSSGASSGTQPFSTDVSDAPFKIQNIGFVTTSTTTQTAQLTFNVTIQDGDGDTASQTLVASVTSSPDSSSPATVAPVVLDTNHDGVISYLGLEAGVAYDYDGDGVKEGTAWVAPGDSILVRDADGNGTVTNASEFVFGGSGQTDLEALHAQYGEQLDANDAGFVQFMLWNDANSNGIADAGELHSLTDAGIVSISLVSDGISSSAANGDVAVAGTSRFAFVNDNGETKSGLLADAAFRTVDRGMEQAQRIGAAANSAALVTAAVAAVGLAASQAAARDHGQPASNAAVVVEAGKVESHVDGGSIALDQAHSRALLGNETRVAADDDAATSHSSGLSVAADVKIAIEAAHDSHELSGLLAGTDLPVSHDGPASPIAPMIVIPTIESWEAAAASEQLSGMQRGVTVEKVLAEALDGGAGGGDVDAILAALPTVQGAANPGLEALASHDDGGVSAWDMGPAGHLSASLAANILTDMTAFHHDAVQPVVNG